MTFDENLAIILAAFASRDGSKASTFEYGIDQIKQLISEVIGEDEKPDKHTAQYLMEGELSLEASAVRFHTKNVLRKKLRHAFNLKGE